VSDEGVQAFVSLAFIVLNPHIKKQYNHDDE
jgi:hypothetical protein